MSKNIIYSASWLINPDAPPLAGGALLAHDGIVVETGTLSALRSKYSAPVVDYPGSALLPGFVNAHTHLELTHFPAWLHTSSVDYAPFSFADWIIQLIKIKRGLTVDDYGLSITEGVRMCLESGTTAIGEIVSNPAMAEHYYRSPLAGRLYFELLGQENGLFQSKLASAMAAVLSEDVQTIPAGLSPHSPYTIAVQHLDTIRDTSAAHRLPLAVHLSESRSEVDFVFDGSGDFASTFFPFVGWESFLGNPPRCSSTELLHRNGLLTPKTVAVHCVHISESDAGILKKSGAHIALCPRSNDLLDVGRAPVALFKKLGIPLSLGTDSLASNNSLSLWDELRFTLEIFPDDLAEQDIFKMVTTGGAAALGISATSGSLSAGKRADFQVVGNFGSGKKMILERIIRDGRVHEVFVRGERYCGNSTAGH